MAIDIDSLEARLRAYKELSSKIRELEQPRKQIGQELLHNFPVGLKKYSTPHFRVFRQERINVKTTLEDAHRYRAVKVEETVDKERLKALHNSGQPIPGVTRTEFVQVREMQNG
ncbi:MAG: hypothetical protein ACE5GN_06825 [Waddliaceae bacterium]